MRAAHRPIARAVTAAVIVMLATTACGSGRSERQQPTSVSWKGESSARDPVFAVIATRDRDAQLVAASFTPSNDVIVGSPVTNDFSEGNWLLSVRLVLPDDVVTAGTYSGAALDDPVLYYFDGATGQTNSELLSTVDARVVITQVDGTRATGFVEVRDDEDAFAVAAPFRATIRSR